MNKKLRMIASVAPLILVPLIKERSKIKDHPDVVKLNDNSKLLYGKAKGSVGAATTKVKHAGSVVADKTKDSAEFTFHLHLLVLSISAVPTVPVFSSQSLPLSQL